MKRFKKIYVEITNVCNLSCSFCAKTLRKPRFIKPEEFAHVLDEVKPFTDYIYLHLMGEPLLHPQLRDLLELCRKYEIKVNLTTNGTLIHEAKDTLLHSSALRKVGFSVHSFEANRMDQSLHHYLEDICSFIKEAEEKSIICELRLWNGDSKNRSGKNSLNEDVLDFVSKEFQITIPYQENMQRNLKLRDRLFINFAQIFDWPDANRTDTDEAVFCYGLRDHIGVLADGTVVPCCLDHEGSLELGNLFLTPLSEILASDRAQKIYDGFSRRKAYEPLCSQCGYARRF